MAVDDGELDQLHELEFKVPDSPEPEQPIDGYVEYSEVTLDEKEMIEKTAEQ